MSEEIGFNDLILYLSAVALVLFYLVYMPWTAMSAFSFNAATLWLYYFTLVLGLLFPLYYAIGRETMAWIVLGLAIFLNSFIMMAELGNWLFPGVMMLVLGILFFLPPFIEDRFSDKELMKNLFHIFKGLVIILAVGAYANWNMSAFVGNTSFNHAMPQFLFIGGGLFIAFGFILLAYGLFKILPAYMPDNIGGYFKDLSSVFYILMVVVFLLGITFNVSYYPGINHWSAGVLPTSIDFFANMSAVGIGNLGAILLIILYIYGMMKIVAKNVKEEEAQPVVETV